MVIFDGSINKILIFFDPQKYRLLLKSTNIMCLFL